MGVALLDVNVLVSLFDPDHVHHDAAHAWFGANRGLGWATCPLTENGLVRILANTAYSDSHETTESVRKRLVTFCASGDHAFWAGGPSIRDDRFRLGPVTFRQITDVYLLGLAVEHGGRLATFDRRIPVRAVVGAETSIEVIPA